MNSLVTKAYYKVGALCFLVTLPIRYQIIFIQSLICISMDSFLVEAVKEVKCIISSW